MLFIANRIKDQHKLLHYSPRLKKACVRPVVLDKRPLIIIVIVGHHRHAGQYRNYVSDSVFKLSGSAVRRRTGPGGLAASRPRRAVMCAGPPTPNLPTNIVDSEGLTQA